MKLNKIKALCKKRNTVYLYNRHDGSQMISDGVGFWPVAEDLRLTESALQAIFEVGDKQWNESWIHETTILDELHDMVHLLDQVWDPSAEVQFEMMPDCFTYKGTAYRALRADDGTTIFVPEAQLRSINDDAQYYMLRTNADGGRLLAVYDSLLMAGLVAVATEYYADEIRAQLTDWAMK